MKFFFKDRIIVIYDNLRTLYPIAKENYIEKADNTGTEKRPNKMPVYLAEQIKVGNHYFYSIKHFNDNLKKEPFFSIKKELSSTQMAANSDICILDVISNPYRDSTLMLPRIIIKRLLDTLPYRCKFYIVNAKTLLVAFFASRINKI